MDYSDAVVASDRIELANLLASIAEAAPDEAKAAMEADRAALAAVWNAGDLPDGPEYDRLVQAKDGALRALVGACLTNQGFLAITEYLVAFGAYRPSAYGPAEDDARDAVWAAGQRLVARKLPGPISVFTV